MRVLLETLGVHGVSAGLHVGALVLLEWREQLVGPVALLRANLNRHIERHWRNASRSQHACGCGFGCIAGTTAGWRVEQLREVVQRGLGRGISSRLAILAARPPKRLDARRIHLTLAALVRYKDKPKTLQRYTRS